MKRKSVYAAGFGLAIFMAIASLNCKEAVNTITNQASALSSLGGTRQEPVVDPAYGMTAFTIEVPAGWKFAGMILRPGGCHQPPFPAAGLSYTEASPDGLTEVVNLPGVSWTWTSSGYNMLGSKCPSNTDIKSAAGLLLNIAVPNLHPDAKKVTLVPLPQKFIDTLAAQNEKLAAQSQRFGQHGPKQFVDAARVHVDYERNGQAMEEMEFTIINCTESTMPGMPMGPGRPWGKSSIQRSCYSHGTGIRRAPKGHLKDLTAGLKPPQINPEWDQRVSQDMKVAFQRIQAASDAAFKQNMANFKAEGDARLARGREFNANLQATTDRAMAADRSRQAAIDDSAHRTELYSLDQQEFRNPNTGEVVRASNQYNHQWMSSDGSTLIQTNDHTYDPNGQVYPVSQSWTELVPK
jgi:hypothetical protein